MHEELVKVTNELYTVSTTDRPFTLCLAAARLRGVSRFCSGVFFPIVIRNNR